MVLRPSLSTPFSSFFGRHSATPVAQVDLPDPLPEGLSAYEEELQDALRLFLKDQAAAAEQLVQTHRAILGKAVSKAPESEAPAEPAACRTGEGSRSVRETSTGTCLSSTGTCLSQRWQHFKDFLVRADTVPTDAGRLEKVVGSNGFEIATAFLVMCYSICLGLDVHVAMTTTLGTRSNIPEAIVGSLTCAFTVLVCAYAVEMALRMLAKGRGFFCGPGKFWEKVWNVTDLCILVFSVLDLVITLSYSQMQKIQFLANFRSLRFLRFLRTLRMLVLLKFFPDLRKMLWALVACMKSFVWGMLLMFITFYFFAIFLEDAALHVLTSLRNEQESRGAADPGFDARVGSIEEGLKKYWDGMYQGMLSLIFSISGGQDWANMGAPFLEINIFYGCVFTGFIFISLFGTLNVLVGVFVQKANEIDQRDKDLRAIVLQDALQESDTNHENKTEMMKELFRMISPNSGVHESLKADTDVNQKITVDTLRKRVNGERVTGERVTGEEGKEDEEDEKQQEVNKKIMSYFRHLGIHVETTESEIFQILDANGDGVLSEDEFVKVCRRLQGSAMPAQLEHLSKKVDSIMSEVSGFKSDFRAMRRGSASSSGLMATPLLHGR